MRRPNSTLSRTVSQGKRASCWKITPRSGLVPRTGIPSTSASPAVGSSRLAAIFRSVLLPYQLSPSVQTNSLAAIAMETSAKASTWENIGRGLPSEIPVVLLGRLALDASLHGQHLGGALLADAFRRAVQSSPSSQPASSWSTLCTN